MQNKQLIIFNTNSQWTNIKRNFSNLNKSVYRSLIANIIINGKPLELFPIQLFLFNIRLNIRVSAI